jgi:hypothetical protein
MTTIGYGDIHPVNVIEKAFMIVISLISCSIFAFAFSQIG